MKMLLLKRRILLFLSKLSVLHNNPSEYFQKHKISKTKHSLQREVQWLKTTIIIIFALSKVSALCGHISLVFVWTQPNIIVQISACNCQNCKLFSVEQQSPQSISIMQFTHLPICLSTHSLTIWAEQSSSTRWFSLHQNLHSATMHCNARGGKNLEESNCHKASMHCKASCR